MYLINIEGMNEGMNEDRIPILLTYTVFWQQQVGKQVYWILCSDSGERKTCW